MVLFFSLFYGFHANLLGFAYMHAAAETSTRLACLLIDVIEYSSLYMMAGEEVFRSS